MTAMEIRRADELGESARAGISEVFIDGFGEWFEYFSKDRATLVRAFAHIFVLDQFYVALVDGEPAAITACTDGVRQCVDLRGRDLRRHLGFGKGTIARLALPREFKRPWPEPKPGTASLEFVATAARYRGRGVATALLNHLLALPGYREHVLEDIADTNASALALYEKLGFREFRRVKVRHTKRTGISCYVSMRRVRD